MQFARDRFLSAWRGTMLLGGIVGLIVAGPAWAKPNDPLLKLEFVPQQTVAPAAVVISGSMRERAVEFRLLDGRGLADPMRIGQRTDDDDRLYDLRAAGEVVGFVDGVLRQLASRWGARLEAGAPRVLEATVERLEVVESNQAVGATYQARVRLALVLRDRTDRQLWSGTAVGDATRYGRKFSNHNCNEVLSDALLEAWADALSDGKLQSAWAGVGGGSEATAGTIPSRAPALAPPRLLEQVRELAAQGLQAETLAEFVRGKTLTRKLDAEDLGAWKAAGVPEEVIRAALGCPIG